MKEIKDICFILQSRINSKRLPKKVIREFAGTTLFNIAIEKLVNSKLIPNENIYCSLYDEELKDIAKEYPVNIFHRSKESVSESTETKVVLEWGCKLPYKWFVILNPCSPLLSINTIESFVKHFLQSPYPSLFSVHETKNFYWNSNQQMITPFPGALDTKLVETTYSGAHVLYAGANEDIANNVYLGDFTPNYPELYVVDEKETLDIDYEWQFKIAEQLYKLK
jgi:CMP-N-acetylneuraminic acid synthetase